MNGYLEAQRAFINIKHPNFLQEIYPPNDSVATNSETKSTFYVEPNLERYGLKSSNDALNKSTGNLNTNKKYTNDKLHKSTENLNTNKITNSGGVKKIFNTKNKISKSVKEDPKIQDQTVTLHNMVKLYMKVINTAIMDMTPKYIILHLIQGTLSFVKLELAAGIFEGRDTDADKLDLLEIAKDEQTKIDELVSMEASVKKAIELVKNVPMSI